MSKSKITLSQEDQVKAVSSIYSSPSKLAIATFVYKMNGSYTVEIADRTGMKVSNVSQRLKEMVEAGVMKTVTPGDNHKKVYYHLTDLGIRIVTMFG